MKKQCFVWLGLFLLAMVVGNYTALAQSVFPGSQTIIAGDQNSFVITGLNTDTNLPPVIAHLRSEYSDRVVVDTDPIQQQLTADKSNYVGAIGFSAVAVQRLDGEVTPVPIDITLTQGGGVFGSLVCYVTVDDPIFTFSPASPAVRVGDTVPLVIRRVALNANAWLDFSLVSGDGAVLALGTDRNGPKTNTISVTFEQYEWAKTVYVSGLSLIQGVTSTNIHMTAHVGSYAATSVVLVTRNSGLILAPADPATAAGDALSMTVSRTSTTNVSPLEVHLTTDDPLTLFIPSTVIITSGQQSMNFSVIGRAPGRATLHATAIGIEDNTNSYCSVTVLNPALSFSQNPVTNTVGGARVITVNRPYNEAGGDLEISWVSLAPTYFQVDENRVVIPAGYISATTTVFGLSPGTGHLQASVGSFRTNLEVFVTDPSLIFSPSSISNVVGDRRIVTITRPSTESANDLTLTLSSLSPDIFSVDDDQVTIPSGQQSVTFEVIGISGGSGVLEAQVGSYSTNLIVTVGNPTLMFTPNPLTNRVGEVTTVTIRRPVSQAGASLSIQLSTPSEDIIELGTTVVTMDAGDSDVEFLVSGLSIGSARIDARVGSYTTSLWVTVPSTTLELSAPVAVRVGQETAMTVTRGGDSPLSSLTVALEGGDFNEFLSVPASAFIQAGQSSATFNVVGLVPTTGVEVRASAAGYPSASVVVPVIPTNPLLQFIVWRDVDGSRTYSAGDTVTLTFNSSMATSTVTTTNLTLKELNASYAWMTSPTGSWGAGSTITVLDPGVYTKFMISLAGTPVLGANMAVDPAVGVTDLLGYPDATGSPVYLPTAEADSNTNSIPDWWEELHFGCATCVDANADPDGDGLINLWEFRLHANPLDAFSLDPALGVKDGDWDSDGDGVINRLEINEYGTDPSAEDTDDDGWTDGQELDTSLMKMDWWRGRRITSPLFSRSPLIQRSMLMTGSSVVVPDEAYLDRAEWMIDLWVQLTNSTSTGKLVCRKTNTGLTNFCLHVENNIPTVEFQSPIGVRYAISGSPIPLNRWTHLTASWFPTFKSLELKQNEITYQAQIFASACAQGRGQVMLSDAGLFGYLDKVMIRNPLPVDVVFVLDISGSMSGDRIVALKEAATLAIDLLPQDTSIGLVAFSDDATNLTHGFSTDRIKLKRIINSLVVKNLTDYTKAIDCATNLVGEFSTLDRHLMIFISDGEPNPPESAPTDDLLLQCANMGIVINTIGFQLYDPSQLQRMSNLTDGKFYDAPTAQELKGAFAVILKDLYKTRYLFDDGGVTAEDFERPLNWSNALSGVIFVTNTCVETTDLDLGDTEPPQWWQSLFFGPNGCDLVSDSDKDGLINLYEYYSDANPRDDDTDQDGVLDGAEDYDGDGLQNIDEQTHASDPRLTDTDDDGVSDLSEKLAGTDPSYSLSPYIPRVMCFGGTTNDFLTIPLDSRFKLSSWTLEAWVNPASNWSGNGSVIYREVELGETNFFLALDEGMRPIAGFGRHSVVGTMAISNNSVLWTHLAATYDSAAQEIKLFVNATQVANRVCSENPRGSGKGPVVQRIGQAFNGMLDEVRIWNVSRNPEDIASTRDRSLSGSEPGLIAYYRFDDNTRWAVSPTVIGTSGNNITNDAGVVDPAISPWSWGQVEDFAMVSSKKDWTNRWKHAVTMNGSVMFSNAPAVTLQYPAVRVMLRPAPVVGEGARWSLNGGAWLESGDVMALTDTNNLSVSLGYRSIYGWTEPFPETVQLTNGLTRTLVRYYQLNGSLSVFLEPTEARSNGALWRIDGGKWWSSETVVSNVSPGAHQLDYKTIDGWQEPPLEMVQLGEGQAMSLSRFYSTARGVLIVNIYPEGALAAGAQWSVDDGGWQNSGTTNSLTPGNHNVSFRDIPDWTTPASQQVAVVKGQTSIVNVTYQYGVRSVSGTIFNESLWNNRPPRSDPPGDGSGIGRIMVGAWLSSTEAYGLPLYQSLLATNTLPAFGSNYAYSINYMEPQPVYLGYQVRAWIDADYNGRYDLGEPASAVSSFTFVGDNVGGINVTIEDDLDSDSLPEWWEAHWFGNIGQSGDDDFDQDGLSNLQEYQLSEGASGLLGLNPANFDTDGDGMDDQWEIDHFADGKGLNPTTNEAFGDLDGDGLANIQEYNGVDGLPAVEQDMGRGWGIASTNRVSTDDLNPLDVDTDGDSLVDSFEAAWFDRTSGVDPKNGVTPTGMLDVVWVKADGTTVTNTTTLAGSDPDQDGLTHYREQCLLAEFREGGSNDIWSAGASSLPLMNTNGIRAFSPPLRFGATNSPTITGDLSILQAQEWTCPGNPDTDGDLLPDGWEVEYSLDPRSSVGADGFWGDPDGDHLLNSQEYLGQDGNRSTNWPYVNGSGDETNPREHPWRLDSTGPGPGTARPMIAADYWFSHATSPTNGTLGAALPTAGLGYDLGLDTDDDGIPDDVEILMGYQNVGINPSPVHPMSPFIKRSALIQHDDGIEIPDPEGVVGNFSPLLHKRDWTLECYVKLLDTNMTGYLIDNPGPVGMNAISYRLSLSNNVPTVSFHTLGGVYYQVVGATLPTGKWVHLAASWGHANNSLSLYVDGVFVQDQRIMEEALSSRLYGSATPVVIGYSVDGTFSNRLMMDEIRIWGVTRTGSQIDEYRAKLVPQNSAGLLAYYRFDDGGETAEDFARKAKNGLLGATSEEYLCGDFGYALRTNSFVFVTNDFAMVYGVDARGADDSDGDHMADDWEVVNHLNPLSTNGVDGAWADPDGDGLINIYEYWSETNPHSPDSDQNGVLDVNEDRDSDGVVNLTEQQLGSRPDLVDTDDDGLTDNEERGLGTNPADAIDPARSRSIELDGASSDYMEVPISLRQRMVDWTLEAWVNPANEMGGVGTIVRRVVQDLGNGVNALNFVLGLETNASGVLQAYAGYVLADGHSYLVHGGVLLTGTWTHVAAVYNSANASLELYTNGYIAASSNGLYSAPPINGKGGETFLRIGEDFQGCVDEVRLWNLARTSGQIRTNYTKTVSEDLTNLVHYFRFDDGQATTNIVAFNSYHKPYGAQDFTHPRDWMEEWRHAISFHGGVRFVEPGGVMPPPSLRLTLLPAAAIGDGAQWSLDGGGYNNSGVTLNNLSPGLHTILYKSISGWTAPSNEVITLTNGVAATLTRSYVQNGSLTVNLEPLGVVSAGAQWRLDGGAWQDSGVTVDNLSPTVHSVEFKSVDGWAAPPTETLMIGEGEHITITMTYGASLSLLEVNLLPPAAILAGAQWNVNGGVWRESGTRVALSSGLITVGYKEVPAWIGPSNETINLIADMTTSLTRVYVQNTSTDTDQDGMLDAWEVQWFENLDANANEDPDRDGLPNIEEFRASVIYTNLTTLSPLNFDSDGDGMDDRWEFDHYLRGVGLNPCTNDAMQDLDGDGLSNVQEYNGVDGLPRLEQDIASAFGIASTNIVSGDALNPQNIDSDDDGLVDSFEAAWSNPLFGIDPTNRIAPFAVTNITVVVPGGTNYSVVTTLAGSDPDQDGMTDYREQCLLAEFSQGGSNDIWSYGTNGLPKADTKGLRAFNPPLLLGATNATTISGDLIALRNHEWTSPADADTDDDQLPDGWEVEFELDPRSAAGDDGFYGDPDGDSRLNSQEYLGQDGLRATNAPFINGSGDETNPKEHPWRPDSTDVGPGIMRPAITNRYWYDHATSPTNGTLGAARPTTSLGSDDGLDTDDDGLPDNVEIQMEYSGGGVNPSPVHSMSPFIKRSMMITNAAGVGIPDPEGAVYNWRALLHRNHWTIECYVKLLGTNLTGYLVNNSGPVGGDVTYRLGLTNNVPYIAFHTISLYYYKVVGPELPTNRWIHLAGVWNDSDNSLSLYVDGVFIQAQRIVEAAMSEYLYSSAEQPVIGYSADGSFANRLMMDEIRIWGVSRTAEQIDEYRAKLVPQNSTGLLAYYRFDDGGATAEDFARKAQNGLFTAIQRDYSFGDFGYALQTNGFCFVTNDCAAVLGVDARGADDTDGDGMPDDWEVVNHLNSLSTNGVDGSWDDPDGDGLVNIYEYWSETNPHSPDSDQNGVLDINEDRDGDGVANLTEQQLGSRPDMMDTDDDGLSDSEEQTVGANPANAIDPAISRAIELDGAVSDYLDVPLSILQRTVNWTIEAWVNPSSLTGGGGTIVRRVVQNLGSGVNAMNYVLGLETNSTGQLQVFGGYVLPDGREVFARGGTLATGTWTYIAASFDSLNATLALYTNGYLAVLSNAVFSTPPINGKGGETFLRMGEGFNGRMDEVRLWNIARSAGQIQTNYNKTVSEAQTNLIHYFRFDDGQAVTNRFSFGPYHQPHGAQDFVYQKDWMQQWRHAAMLCGHTRFVEPGGLQPPAALRIHLLPAGAVTAGAQWSLDGGSYYHSGDTIGDLEAGVHTLLFKSIFDWTAPSNEVIELTNGVVTTLTRTYLRNGSLTVNIEPLAVVVTGAQWRVDGGAWRGSSTTVSNLSPGTHLLEFKPVNGWVPPLNESVVISEAANISITRTYVEGLASLVVYLLPTNAVAAGAQWRIDGGAWRNSGSNITIVAGNHELSYQTIPGWIEPSNELVNLIAFTTVSVTRVYLPDTRTDTDGDNLLDAWEMRWFGTLAYGAADDPDHDGLKNIEEFQVAQIYTNLDALSPVNFDSDDDGMDDLWEFERYRGGAGLNPTVNDAAQDCDGDGLINVQEYNGMDGWPRLMQNPMAAPGVAVSNAVSADDLNPLHYDTDGDHLVDSFEAAWFNAAGGIDPLTTGTLFSTDSDADGMSCYREQCLLREFREGELNDIWSHGTNDLPGMDYNGIYAFYPPLQLGATNSTTILGDLAVLRSQEWTDPENEDTDDDGLPDGWEVEFNLDPKNVVGANGFWGDPDGDGLLNSQEYLGQDGNRSTNHPNVNGTGDETNPNQHNWRPVTTGPGPGNMRPAVAADYWYIYDTSPTNGTLGSALPTASLGFDRGLDTDDDGIPDHVEIQSEYLSSGFGSSPVQSMSPFIKRSALIKKATGIEIPDPEGSPFNYSPLLHGRDWTIECYVKLLSTNLTGYLVNNPGPFGTGDISYRLSLTNNAPIVAFHTLGGFYYKVSGPTLPTNTWIHLAGVWDHANNSLSLYIDGIYFQAQRVTEEALSSRIYASVTPAVLGASADGSFTNHLLMDEIRIWGIARSAEDIEQYRRKLVPQNSVGLLAYYRFDDGGMTAEDFVCKAKNGLLGADSTDYSFGDFGYALRTNGFTFVTNDYAMVLGTDVRGADDTDGDGMPDDWEVINHLNPSSTNGVNGAVGDADGDGLINIYEYWSDTNPNSPDTDQNGVLDINEDRDRDGAANLMEQRLGSRPDMMDTDDDGLTDNIERLSGTSPIEATDPQVGRAVELGGAAGDFLEIPNLFGQRLTDWSLEAWVNPRSGAEGTATVVRRVVQNLGPSSNVVNYVLGLETNLTGTLQICAGYVDAYGREYFVRGGTIPTGSWTHVAATYNWQSSMLAVYTNGVLAAISTNYFSAPPLNGKGGETFVRIGENFGGVIDEVRVWSDTRTQNEILSHLNDYVDTSSQGLIHYFSFDDSQANTNTFPFGTFHQPFGAQDLVYPQDWANQWIHAAMLRGDIQFITNSPVTPPPSIQVFLAPQAAVDAGAQWSLDGGMVWRNSGETVLNLAGINVTVTYKNVIGWTAPPTETVILTNGQKSVLNRVYIQIATNAIYVELQPPEAVSAGAGWRFYGQTTYLPSGSTVSTNAGTYILEFKSLTDWLAPGNLTVTIQTGETVYVRATYLRSTFLFTNIVNFLNNPRGLALDSQRRLYIADSGNNRIVVYDTQTGAVTNWGGPTNGSALGQFYQPQAIAIDANDNVYIADTHNYRIQRRHALTNSYMQWTNINPWDIALDWQTNLYVAEYYNNRVQKLNPVTGIWTTFVFNGIQDGLVRSPGGVAVDASNRIVVADYPDNKGRIQRFGTNGIFMGRLGSSLSTEGSFGKPQSLAFGGSSGALFVSDIASNCVLRRNGDASWQTVIGAGMLQGVGGLAWDAQGYLYVSDTVSDRVLRVSMPDLADIPPSLISFTQETNGMVLTWWGAVGWHYTLQYTDSLLDPWTNVTGSVEMKGAYRIMSCIDTNNLGIPSRIYRMLHH